MTVGKTSIPDKRKKNGQSHADIDHKSGTETETRYRRDEGLCLSTHLQEVSQFKVKRWIYLTDNFIF